MTRTAALVIVLAALVVCVPLALLAAGTFEPKDSSVGGDFTSAGDLAITTAAGWAPADQADELDKLGLVDGIALRDVAADGGATLLLGQNRKPAPSLLSPELREILGGDDALRAPEIVELAVGQALRHRGADGAVAYLLPNDRGVATAVCIPGAGGPAAGCEAMVSGIAMPGATPVAAAPDVTLQSALTDGITDLNGDRVTGWASLRAKKTPVGQASAAGRLAAMHAATADALGEIEAPELAQPAAKAVVQGLDGVAAAFRKLAGAATNHDTVAFLRARSAVGDAERDVNAALDDLRLLGYGAPTGISGT